MLAGALARYAVVGLPFLGVLEAEALCEDERLLERKRLSLSATDCHTRVSMLSANSSSEIIGPNRQMPADFDDSLASLTTLDG